ncbi:hypothetical protein [Nonomuraea sp. NPDC050691]
MRLVSVVARTVPSARPWTEVTGAGPDDGGFTEPPLPAPPLGVTYFQSRQ